ncbi:MAG: LysR family transcriptional regulator [Brevibacillus sp.]|nr:LysR family transcriptional regulator [Brevibacillus sp.]
MEEKDWLILLAVFEEKNITKAANRLFMAQTTLTYRLQQMEKEFETILFFRGRRGVEFTAQGELLVKYAKEMLMKLKHTKEALLNLDGIVSGTLKLAVTKSFAFYKLPAILKSFSNLYPNVDFIVNTGSNLDLTHSLHKQETHVAIVRGIHHWPDERQTIAKENICVIAKEEIRMLDLPSIPRIDYEPKPSLDIIIDNWWRENFSKPPLLSMMVDNVEIAKRMVINDLGYTIAPSSVIEEHEGLFKVNLTTANSEPIIWETSILYRKEMMKLPAVRVFVEFIRNHITRNKP